MYPLKSLLHILSFIDSLLHRFQKLFFHIEVHIRNEVINYILRLFNLGQIIFEFDIFHHISLLKNRIR